MHKNVLSLLLASTLLAGCHQNEPIKKNPNAPQKKEQILRFNHHGSPASLHPHAGIDLPCRIFQKALLEGLTRLNSEGVPELAAAAEVEISPSQTTYTFKLRPLEWSNGENVSAYHFEKAWKKALSPGSYCLRSDLFYPIKNAQRAKKGEVGIDEIGIYALSSDTLVVELEHPTPYFLDLIANPLFSPLYDDATSPEVFNGPFRIALLEHDKKMILEKNPLYWDAENVVLEQIHFSFVADPSTAVMLYEKGEIDWVGHPFTNLPVDAIPKLELSEEFHSQPIAGVYWLCLNTEHFPLNSAKIRKALSVSLNRHSLAQHVLLGETPIATISSPFVKESENCPDDNPKLAKKLFQEGLRELNISPNAFPTLVFSHSDVSGHKKLAEAIQQCWEKTLGIKVQLQNAEWNIFFASLGERQYQIGGCIWFSAFNDPIYYLEFFKDKTHRYNSPQWENTHYQKLLQLSDQETNPVIRQEHLKQAEELLLEDMPIIPLYIYNAKYLKSSTVKGLPVSNLGQVDFKWAYLAPD